MALPTPPREPDSVPVLTSIPLPAFTQAWQLRPPRDAQILTVKGTFDLVPGGPATPAEEQALPLGPTPFEDAEDALVYPGDMAFFKPRCDVFLTGHAYRSRKAGPPVQRVEMRLGRDLHHAFAAIGERTWQRGAPSEPAHFEKIPLRPERAFGGPDDPNNPLGVGRAGEGGRLPSFERLDRLLRSPQDRPPPALTTPIPETWPSRQRFVGDYGGGWAASRAPYFPDSFRYDFFQAAPPELQIAHPRGDEWYRLAGVRPDDEILEGRLPSLRVRAFAQPLASSHALKELPMQLDTVWFDADQLQVILVWRGAIEVEDQYGSDLASFFVLAEPSAQPCGEAEIHRRFTEAYRAAHERAPEEDEPEEEPAPQPPEGYVPPRGLTTDHARALGLPPWAATVASPPLEPKAPPPPAPALAPAALAALLDRGGSLGDEDLSHCDLTGRDLSGRDLAGALLIGADLSGVSLAGATLSGAVLTDAKLDGCDASGADLRGASLAGASLSNAKLTDAKLDQASLDRTRATDAQLDGASLDGASVSGADWSRVSLRGARLAAADFTDTRLEDADLTGAQMPDVRLYGVAGARLLASDAAMDGARVDGAVLSGASLTRVTAAGSSLRKCDFSDADLSGATFEDSVFEDSVFDRANLNQVEAKSCRWPRAKAHGATFVKANLMRGYFEGAELAECDLRGANLYDAQTFRATFRACRLEHAILGESGVG